MSIIPNEMDKNKEHNLMTLLYEADIRSYNIEMSEQIEGVNRCMSFIPNEMDKNKGCNLMTLLYEAGFVSNYLDALEAGKWSSYFVIKVLVKQITMMMRKRIIKRLNYDPRSKKLIC